MRQVVISTTATNEGSGSGARIIEIAAVELFDSTFTGRMYHNFVNPGCENPSEIEQATGLSAALLADKPSFSDVAESLTEFVGADELILHNPQSDIEVLDRELHDQNMKAFGNGELGNKLTYTLELARKLHPGQDNTVEALGRLYGVDESDSGWGGALYNAERLASVYLAGFASLRLEYPGDPEGSRIWLPNIEAELIAQVKNHPERTRDLSPRKFEELVAAIFRNNGFDVELTPETRDGGVDIIAVESSRLTGKSLHLIECKRYAATNKVGVGVVRQLLGTVVQRQATKGIIVTSSSFTRDAVKSAAQSRHVISLSDFETIRGWLNGAQQNVAADV